MPFNLFNNPVKTLQNIDLRLPILFTGLLLAADIATAEEPQQKIELFKEYATAFIQCAPDLWVQLVGAYGPGVVYPGTPAEICRATNGGQKSGIVHNNDGATMRWGPGH